MYQGVLNVYIAPDDPDAFGEMLLDFVEAYARVNARWIEKYDLPALYDTHVHWERTLPFVASWCSGEVCERPERVDLWRDVKRVYEEGKGDCKDLVAIRLAERWLAGDHGARPRAIRYPEALGPGYDLFHVVLEHGDGTLEDPSDNLGMEGVG